MKSQNSISRILMHAIVIAFMGTGFLATGSAIAGSSTSVGDVSDDIGPDGLKRRGDGSIDDQQPGRMGEDSPGREHENRIVIEDTDVRERAADGTRTRERTKTTVNPITGVQHERTRSEVRNPDGSLSEVRTDKRIAADGSVLRERTRTRERAARADRGERGERADRSERAERAERPERAERAERPERPERAERAERSGS